MYLIPNKPLEIKYQLALNELEMCYLNLIEDKTSIENFENWVYNSEWLEEELTVDN